MQIYWRLHEKQPLPFLPLNTLLFHMFPLCRPEPPLVTHGHKHAHLHAYAVLEAIFTKFSLLPHDSRPRKKRSSGQDERS